MKTFVYSLIASLLLGTGPLAQNAFADKADRLQDDLSDAKKDYTSAKKDYDKCRAEAPTTGVTDEVTRCESKLTEFEARHPDRKKWNSDDEYSYKLIEDECNTKRTTTNTRASECDTYKSQMDEAKANQKDIQKKIDRLEDEQEKKDNADCATCNKDAAKYQGKSGWESFADIIKAATPLGLGAMGLYGGIKAMNLQSSDYNNYASMMNANGLPFAPPSANGYGGVLGQAMGPAFLASMMMNGSGVGGCCFSGGIGLSGGIGGGIGMGGMGMMGGYAGMMGGYPGGMMGMSGSMVGGFAGAIVGGISGGMYGGYPGMGMAGISGYPMGMAGSIVGGFGGAIVGGISGGM